LRPIAGLFNARLRATSTTGGLGRAGERDGSAPRHLINGLDDVAAAWWIEA